ncbi:SGNH/GDSL hydrolase family protein [Paenibacillus arenilitoris]|uniref:SGNH/GDSL hydrolase family protein n=1 Tax=Paenibacillus arenilitoris TaxID=2772299 RepID=A0A927H6W1_9BACL|nr:SGNH/GDSL hydrolase family protein [Paenibacillus arenilitoris]MBD2870976.1 SGNH/GDSL hydrolase family protein [Paenibacillus arenilitoris]
MWEPIKQWKEQSDKSYRICAFGSSNTELSLANDGKHNWVDWLYINLRKEIGNHVTVTNLGIGGETTIQLLDRMERDVKPLRPSLVIVTIGGNDASIEIPTALYAERLKKICSLIRSYQAIPVLQTYYCPVYSNAMPGFRERFEANMQANRELAAEMGLKLVDQYSFFEPYYRMYPNDYEKLMRDWLHVNHLGNLAMAQYISRSFGLSELPVPDEWESPFVPIYEKMIQIANRRV